MKFIILPTSKCTNQWHVAHCHSCAAAPLSDFQPPSSPADTHLYSSGPPPDRPLHPASSPAAPAPARVRVSRTVQEVALGAWLLSLSMESSWLTHCPCPSFLPSRGHTQATARAGPPRSASPLTRHLHTWVVMSSAAVNTCGRLPAKHASSSPE